MTDKEHADKILNGIMDLMGVINDAMEAGLTVRLEPIRLDAGIMSFSAEIKRVTSIAKFP